MSVADTAPVFGLVERLEFLDYQNCGGVAELSKLKPLRIEKFGQDRIFSDRV